MFVAWRDLRHARGRFVLMTSVIALITLLVAFLAALTAGLGRASTSAITDLPVDLIAFSASPTGEDPSFTQSQVSSDQWAAWGSTEGVASAQPLGVAQTRASAGGTTAAVTALGVEPSSGLVPGEDDVASGQVILTPEAAKALGNPDVGAPVTIGPATLTVAGTSPHQADFAHTPGVWITLADWQQIGARAVPEDSAGAGAGSAAGSHDGSGTLPVGTHTATVVALTTLPGADLSQASLARAESATGSPSSVTAAISSFAAENLSLSMMQGFLLVISALVVGVFFTVWTISRGGDIAVIKALGGSSAYLIRDALGQALVVLILGTSLGALAATGLGLAASSIMPVVVAASTMVLPPVLLTVLGLAGALVAIARITRIDPHTALASR